MHGIQPCSAAAAENPGSAGRPSYQMQLRIQDFLFPVQNIICQKLFFYLFKSNPCDRICKTFSCLTLFAE